MGIERRQPAEVELGTWRLEMLEGIEAWIVEAEGWLEDVEGWLEEGLDMWLEDVEVWLEDVEAEVKVEGMEVCNGEVELGGKQFSCGLILNRISGTTETAPRR